MKEKLRRAVNHDNLATAAGAGTAAAILSLIDFRSPGWWKQALVALGVLALGYLINKQPRTAGAPSNKGGTSE